jgi:type III secretion protein Q
VNSLDLRPVDLVEYERRHTVNRWCRKGSSARLRRPPATTSYIAFYAEAEHGDWQGMVDARQWLQRVLPQLQDLLPISCPEPVIAELFAALPRPLEIALDELDYSRLLDVVLVSGSQIEQAKLPCVSTVHGELWLQCLPPRRQPRALPLYEWVRELEQSLQLVLGTSCLSVARTRRLAPGDVLFITELSQEVFLAGRCVGRFTLTEEGPRMELTAVDSATQQALDELASLPVRLEFILNESTLSLAQLNEFIEGQVLPLDTQAYRCIEVRANGRGIARGELVQLDGRLGVELNEVYRSVCNE